MNEGKTITFYIKTLFLNLWKALSVHLMLDTIKQLLLFQKSVIAKMMHSNFETHYFSTGAPQVTLEVPSDNESSRQHSQISIPGPYFHVVHKLTLSQRYNFYIFYMNLS